MEGRENYGLSLYPEAKYSFVIRTVSKETENEHVLFISFSQGVL